jgi:hypothetical protein
MKKLEEGKKQQKKEAPQIPLLNAGINMDKAEKTKKYNRKHKKAGRHKEKGKNKIILRSERSKY